MTTKNNKKYAPLETQTHNRLIVSQAKGIFNHSNQLSNFSKNWGMQLAGKLNLTSFADWVYRTFTIHVQK